MEVGPSVPPVPMFTWQCDCGEVTVTCGGVGGQLTQTGTKSEGQN